MMAKEFAKYICEELKKKVSGVSDLDQVGFVKGYVNGIESCIQTIQKEAKKLEKKD